jgi:hypothetical protein
MDGFLQQMYATIDHEAQKFASQFRVEAEFLWQVERKSDTIMNMASAQLLSLAYIGQGRDHAVLAYLSEACHMGIRLGMFGVEDNEKADLEALTPAVQRACRYTSWGVFNWIVLVISPNST